MSLDELLLVDPRNFEVKFTAIQRVVLKKPGFFEGGNAAKIELHVGERKPTVMLLKTRDAGAERPDHAVLGVRTPPGD